MVQITSSEFQEEQANIITDNLSHQPMNAKLLPKPLYWIFAFTLVASIGLGILFFVVQAIPGVIIAAVMVFVCGTFLVDKTRTVYRRGYPSQKAAQPWKDEIPTDWTRKGSRDSTEPTWWRFTGLAILLILIIMVEVLTDGFDTPSYWIAMGVVILVAIAFAVKTLNPSRFGRSLLLFERFPFFLGETLDVTFQAPHAIRHFNEAIFTLRCVQDDREPVQERNTSHVRMVVISRQIFARQARIEDIEPESDAINGYALSFPLPEGDYGTDVTQYPARYWQLVVEADTVKGPYKRVFRVPVYERPA